jgi:hypothetical protein
MAWKLKDTDVMSDENQLLSVIEKFKHISTSTSVDDNAKALASQQGKCTIPQTELASFFSSIA